MKLILLCSFLILLSACAAMEKEFIENYCNPEGSYSLGVNDFNNGQNMDVSQFNSCPKDKKQAIVSSYNRGFMESKKMNFDAAPKNVVNVNLGKQGRKKYFCKLAIFGKEYKAFGATELEAREEVGTKCANDNNVIHCHGIDCQSVK